MKKIAKENAVRELTPLDGKAVMGIKEASRALKAHGNKVANGDVSSFVSLRNINKVYPNGVQAVYDFNLEIKRHDFIVLVGPSGCGKSTTLAMIAGLADITSGYLYIDKVLSNYLPSKDRDISMVFQSYALYPQMSVFDNIAFPLKVRRYVRPLIAEDIVANQDLVRSFSDLDKLSKALEDARDSKKNLGKDFDFVASKLKISDRAAKKLLALRATSPAALRAQEGAVLSSARAAIQVANARLAQKGWVPNALGEITKDGVVLTKKRHLSNGEIREKVYDAARLLDLGAYLDRKPKELSGGQMQRVALGRAIVRDAKLFLMDEPLSNLDAKLRVAMRSEIVRLHEKIGATTIYVTHDQTEAMTMASRIVVMSKGWIQQVGEPQEVYSHPKNLFVATFIGSPSMNIFDGTYDHGVIKFGDGYAVDLGADFVKTHDDFYKAKILECRRMLETIDDSKEKAALKVFAEMKPLLKPFSAPKLLAKLADIRALIEPLNKKSRERILASVDQASALIQGAPRETKDIHNALLVLERVLVNVETIDPSDIAKIHSAQVFSEQSLVSEATTLSYAGSHRVSLIDKWKANRKKRFEGKPAAKALISHPQEYVENLLASFEEALQGPHEVKLGIRPEHIHLDEEYGNPAKTKAFSVEASVVELMGSELLIHAEWNQTDMIAKISTGTLVKAHNQVRLSFNGTKLHVFDSHSGETIR
jgi:ABC-type sugar transport system ATPase subunit